DVGRVDTGALHGIGEHARHIQGTCLRLVVDHDDQVTTPRWSRATSFAVNRHAGSVEDPASPVRPLVRHRLRLPVSPPFASAELVGFFARRALPGVEEVTADGRYRRALTPPHGPAVIA